jgi:mono/diheme cytochrome c family protein
MLATTAFIVAFVVIALVVLLFAFSARRSRGPRQAGPSRASRRFTAVVVTAVTLALGIAVPALVLAYNNDTQSKRAVGGVELTAAEREGRTLFYLNCGQCHILKAANAVGTVGPNLDNLRPPAALTLNAIAQGRARGQGQMPPRLLVGEDAENVATFIEKVAGR